MNFKKKRKLKNNKLNKFLLKMIKFKKKMVILETLTKIKIII